MADNQASEAAATKQAVQTLSQQEKPKFTIIPPDESADRLRRNVPQGPYEVRTRLRGADGW